MLVGVCSSLCRGLGLEKIRFLGPSRQFRQVCLAQLQPPGLLQIMF